MPNTETVGASMWYTLYTTMFLTAGTEHVSMQTQTRMVKRQWQEQEKLGKNRLCCELSPFIINDSHSVWYQSCTLLLGVRVAVRHVRQQSANKPRCVGSVTNCQVVGRCGGGGRGEGGRRNSLMVVCLAPCPACCSIMGSILLWGEFFW